MCEHIAQYVRLYIVLVERLVFYSSTFILFLYPSNVSKTLLFGRFAEVRSSAKIGGTEKATAWTELKDQKVKTIFIDFSKH